MTEKWKIVKLIAKIVFIVALPVLFFTFIGHNPMKVTERTTNRIAVVNEDVGADYNKKTYEFGKEIVPALDDDSDYQWSVVNRSQAEKGLADGQYDAVVYLPSDFSRNILTFNEKKPLKATIQYKIQPNLEAKNREQVQRELEAAKNTINQKMSTLYWSYVGQAVEDIRKKFSAILEKEIAFQKTMYDFYTPSSAKLTKEIESQKKMLEQLLSSSKNAESSSNDTLKGLEQAEAEIASFIEDIQMYKEYQQRQHDIIQQGIRQYETMISGGLRSVVERPWNVRPELELSSQTLLQSVSKLRNMVTDSHTALTSLYNQLENSNVYERLLESQKDLIRQYQQQTDAKILDEVQQKLIPLRQRLQSATAPSAPNEQPGPGELPQPSGNGQWLDRLEQQLASLKTELRTAKPQLPQETKEGQDASGSWGDIDNAINQLEVEMQKAKEAWQKQLAFEQQWQEKYAQLAKQLAALANNDSGQSEETVVQQIVEKEQAILQSPSLSEERKQQLSAQFQPAIQSRNMNDLLAYFYWLSVFEDTLKRMENFDEALVDQLILNWKEKADIFQTLLNIHSGIYQLQDGSATSLHGAEAVENNVHSFVEVTFEYDKNVEKMQAELMGQLQSLNDAANEVTAQLQQTMDEEGTIQSTVGADNGEFVIAIQQNTLQDITQISDLVTSIAEGQDRIIDYTNEMHEKVASVQGRADELNNKWATNVNTTKQIKNDVYRLLDNTMVDKQTNGYVYDYLTNPVQVSGDIPKEKATYTPPVVMLVIVLLCGMLIGFFLHYYSSVPLMLQLALLIIMNLLVGFIISTYGLRIYPMQEVQALKWSIFTIILLFFCSAIVRLAFFIGPFTGWVLGVGLILFFITPLLDLVLPNFSFDHPISETYMSIQYGDQQAFYPAVITLGVVTVLMSAVPFLKQRLDALQKEAETYEG
ncbi:type VII secretion protein EsaA [Parageobacillus thermoglucosidasius]|uniref:Type VII secretion protein EsaA n=1 Tax=Parageobacillus thermoglucosidasius TaxID=1426 RepID=A0AAN1D5E5_PARTM|nr:type VII secretion protein EsaA [Parageobacillus thermoglucosidasius]ALF08673.1 type VII secretion protein [Parageobacillus thermoglucosidasius]ANZ28756.1 type VII secretion protein EsaA [Parageobacillus thermoglucosidasius]APM79493.1 type VII secretion protein EsaA [Parageobacillus thermoglucosidasius]KJX68395.1 type VII secretion protein [Parageobacillus thermoglucosidasius]MED4905414.1 type VII secretion protein EsaA [Parageobacillus thermoglucosidasius]